ncbi:MAG: hypothetical protein JW891_04450 [Candidatus Lokiarchaeota archaeon]|nr:hypothetical protein [Candidatus Lokiarchaeota archaeon]
MPKFERESSEEKTLILDEEFAFRSAKITLFLAAIFFFISIFFNLIDLFSILALTNNGLLDIINYIIKIASPLLFFLLMTTFLGNYGDILGKPLNWKGMVSVFLFSLFQTIRNTIVLGITFIGLIIVIIYFYLIQDW